MVINIHGAGIDLTPALRQYAEEKMEGLSKFFDNIRQINFDIGRRNNHHQKGEIFYAEANVDVPGHLVRVVKEEADLYKAIDKVKDHLKVDLQKMKEKMRVKDRKGLRGQKEYSEES